MSADEKRIREFAYQIWESEGQPKHQEDRHWEMARKLAEAEALAPDKSTARKAAKPKLPNVDGSSNSKDPVTKPAAKAAAKPAAKAAAKPVAAAPAPKPAASPKAVPKPAAKAKPPAPPAAKAEPAKPAVKKPRKPSAP